MPEPPETLLFRRVPKGLARRSLRDFAATLEREVSNGRRFTCLLTGDAELRRLNREFLGHDYATDVLSFPSPGPGGFLGEMAVSTVRAAAQARELGHSLEDEIRVLMLHGLLHLLGMDHARGRGRMARLEQRLRLKLGLPAGLIERTRT